SVTQRQSFFVGIGMCITWMVGLIQGGAWAQAADLTVAIEQVAKQTIPAVAHIEVTERQEVANPFVPFESDPLFRRFFNMPRMPKKFKREVMGLGTGMLMDAQGHILTNHHVAGGATKLMVLLANGARYTARLVGTDPKTDLAVIKIDAREALPFVTFGDSDKMEVGQWVVAIGHPRGLDQTVTQGIISAKHRRGITDPSSYQDFLQTDAAINPGNSGGPLLNLQGEVIGVNAVIASQSGGFEGIGFAIPSNMGVSVAKALIAHGKVERAWLGVSIRDVTPEVATAAGLPSPQGAVIADVVKGGPAEQAGLKKGDIVVTYQNTAIADASALRNVVSTTPVGQKVKVIVLRDGHKQELTATVRSLEEATTALLALVKERLGVEVGPVTNRDAEHYGMDTPQGVTVTAVDPHGPLGKAGLEVQDILLTIEGQAIEGVDGLAGLVAALKPHQRITVLALDHRSGETGSVQAVIR
ncbi:MAG TPA: trypsin-like peptidase domain-containing protein, partial [Candidatus Tectomicrobia bacterium]|nr:trypsin-like peptidase domain-containing protein [Candidatus Tectomicrobia bacterium]